MLEPAILITHAIATAAMTGVIWMVQLVHYPLFLSVAPRDFPHFHSKHTTRIVWIVAPLMLVEAVTAAWLAWRAPSFLSWLGIALVAGNWGSTALVQMPLHRRLAERYDRTGIERLVTTNWFRTVAWTGRSVVVAAMLAP